MDALQKGILTLVRSALTGQALELPEDFRIEDAAKELKRHQLMGLGYEGAVLCGIPKTEGVMQELFTICYRQLLHSERQLRALNKLYAAFEENGIDYMPVKGCNLKYLYPRPELRAMGDADILFRKQDAEQVSEVMTALGYEETAFGEGVHVWNSAVLLVELHEYLMSERYMDFYRYFADSWKRAQHRRGSRYAMRPEDEFIFTFVHYAKHYRGGGIGLRQPIDLWVWQRAYPEMDLAYIRQELAGLKLLEFFENTMQMLRMWMEEGPENEKLQVMTDYIFLSGSWGLLENRYTAIGVQYEKRAGSKVAGYCRFLVRTLFPSVDVMSNRYPVLKKVPWLVPVMWLVRWGRLLFFQRYKIRAAQKSIIRTNNGKQDSFEKSLAYVGLGFDF